MALSDRYRDRAVDVDALYTDLADRAGEIYNAGKTLPLVILDLDETLFDRRPRVMKILADLLMDEESDNPLTDEIRASVATLKPRTMTLDLEATLIAAGVPRGAALNWLLAETNKRMQQDQYVMFDLPTPGAVEFIKDLSKAGSMMIYLGGLRNKDTASFGTERSISMYELPAPRGEVGALFLRDTPEQDELAFKRELAPSLDQAGEVIAVFENEPVHANAMAELFPGARVTLLDTMRQTDDDLRDGIGVIPSFVR